jgi:hypothetical protein
MLTSYTIDSVRLGSGVVSSIYLGAIKVWPLTPQGLSPFWSGFPNNCCVSLVLTSNNSTGITSGIIWGDGAVSGIGVGTVTYKRAYGTAVC